MTSITRRCRATGHCFVGGRLCEPGDEFTLSAGVRGPHVTHVTAHGHMDVDQDQKRVLPDLHDEPLYEEWDEAACKWVKGAS